MFVYVPAFEDFWKIYPRKKDKGNALRKFNARLEAGFSSAQMLDAAKEYAKECEQNHVEERYIKFPSTFLDDTLPFVDYLGTKEAHTPEYDTNMSVEQNTEDIIMPVKQNTEVREMTEFELKCVDYMILCINSDLSGQKVPVTESEKEKWAIHIRRMQNIDNISQENIWNTLVWTMKDSFWSTNIRSTRKFREKYSTLFLQSKQQKQEKAKKNSFNNFKQNEYDFEALERELISNY